MSYDEEQRRRSRVVEETPQARREVVQTETARVPERRGVSPGTVAALVLGAVALVTVLFLFLMDRQQADNTNVSVATAPTPVPQTTIVQVPVQQPQQPTVVVPPTTVVAPPTTTTTVPAAPASGPDDATIQSDINRRISEDTTLAPLDVDVSVLDGKVTLTGTVNSRQLKDRVERLVKSVKGVATVDNQIIVSGATDSPTPPL